MITKNDRFSYIISQNNSLTPILDLFGVGKGHYYKTIDEVGVELSIDPDFMLTIFKAFDQSCKPDKKLLMKFPLGTILDYLKKTHRYYLEYKIPEMELFLNDIIHKSNQNSSLLVTLDKFFHLYKKKLIAHIKSEEDDLFPYIESIIEQLSGDFSYEKSKKILAKITLQHFEASHNNLEVDLVLMREMTMKNSVKHSNSISSSIFLDHLNLFENELHRHSIIEDAVLVPKAQQLELLLKAKVDRYGSVNG